MAIDKVREHFKTLGIEDRIMEFEVSSATVELAAEAVGTEIADADVRSDASVCAVVQLCSFVGLDCSVRKIRSQEGSLRQQVGRLGQL